MAPRTSEKVLFNGQSDALINDVVLPAPIGGTPFRVYKATANTIDGENKQLLRSLVRDGLVFMNFLGHSGGRIWGVDIGTPADLENTNGMLPFVTSVSCNVAAFAEPSNNVLSEDFVLARQPRRRGDVGIVLTGVCEHRRDRSCATSWNMFVTIRRVCWDRRPRRAGYRLWQSRGSDYITVASMNLNPLLGDPLSVAGDTAKAGSCDHRLGSRS